MSTRALAEAKRARYEAEGKEGLEGDRDDILDLSGGGELHRSLENEKSHMEHPFRCQCLPRTVCAIFSW